MKVKDRPPKEEQQNVVYETIYYGCNAANVGETSRQLTVRLKEYKLCLKHFRKSSVDLMKHENRFEIVTCVRNRIQDQLQRIKIFRAGFGTHKERFTEEALHVWANKNSLNRKHGIQLVTPWQMIVDK